MSKYEIDVWEYADEFKNLDTNETFYGYQVCELLEHKDQQISDLETKLVESESKRKSLEEKIKFLTEETEENFVDGQKYNQLKQQLCITEKALELACREITGSCEYCSYKTRIECPVEADCLDEKINYFKSQAKEMLENE